MLGPSDDPERSLTELRETKLRLEITWLALRIIGGLIGLLGVYGALRLSDLI